MVTYIVMNVIFPGPFVIYAIGFGWIFVPFLIPVDLTIAGILTAIMMRNKGDVNEGVKAIIPIGLCSIATSYILVGGILGIVGIIMFITKFKEYVYDIDAQKYGIFGLICSIISVIMAGIEIYFFFSLFIV